MSKYKVEINTDTDPECPADFDSAWRLYSFCSRHYNFKHPDELRVEVSRNQVGRVKDRKLRDKLANGLAHWLGYFEHGASCWFRTEAPPLGVEFQWDGVRYAGLLVWEHPAKDLGAKTYEDRAKDADVFLRNYTDWANGDGLYYSIEDEFGETVDSCGGFFGSDYEYVLDRIAETVKGHEFTVSSEFIHDDDAVRRCILERIQKLQTV